jgi:Ran GTPase-activating protein (RanGAP) involved in mRNA processing and transport
MVYSTILFIFAYVCSSTLLASELPAALWQEGKSKDGWELSVATNLKNEAIEKLYQRLQSNKPEITTIKFDNVAIDDTNWSIISRRISENSSLKKISLSQNGLGAPLLSLKALNEHAYPFLKEISFKNNALDDHHIKRLTNFLKKNSSCNRLILNNCALSTSELALFAQARIRNLEKLDLQANPLTRQQGGQRLEHSSLTYLLQVLKNTGACLKVLKLGHKSREDNSIYDHKAWLLFTDKLAQYAPSLEKLTLVKAPLSSDKAATAFSALATKLPLTALTFRSTTLTGLQLRALVQLSQLQTLKFKQCFKGLSKKESEEDEEALQQRELDEAARGLEDLLMNTPSLRKLVISEKESAHPCNLGVAFARLLSGKEPPALEKIGITHVSLTDEKCPMVATATASKCMQCLPCLQEMVIKSFIDTHQWNNLLQEDYCGIRIVTTKESAQALFTQPELLKKIEENPYMPTIVYGDAFKKSYPNSSNPKTAKKRAHLSALCTLLARL